MKKRPYISFKAFFLIWAELMHWKVPSIHLVICDWMENRGRTSVLQVWRGAAKSTILAVYQAWRLRDNPELLFLDRSADDGTAQKLTSDTRSVIMRHPLCRGMIRTKKAPAVSMFSVTGNNSDRNASVTGYGILSNATSSRADEIINDDPEVPKNIKTEETRQNLRERLNEETHILIPGGKILYVGTDHTHDSIYKEKSAKGYDTLIIPLFSHYTRHEADGKKNVFSFDFPFKDKDDFYVMSGIYRSAKVYEPDEYDVELTDNGGTVKFKRPPIEGLVIDIATGNQWPERFDRAEIKFKREECLTLNAWDSQYLLEAKPIHEIRLNPNRFVIYEEKPVIRFANNMIGISLGNVPLTSCRVYWDCSLGKKDSDESVFSVMFGDDYGRYYWHVLDVLMGDIYKQCKRVIDRVVEWQLPGVMIETNGPGGFVPTILRAELKKRGVVGCGVIENWEKGNKTKRILDAYESLLSAGLLYVHTDVNKSGLPEQMRDWVPNKLVQADDKIDCGAGAINNMPNKLGKMIRSGDREQGYSEGGIRPHGRTYEVGVDMGITGGNRPSGGTYEVKVEF